MSETPQPQSSHSQPDEALQGQVAQLCAQFGAALVDHAVSEAELDFTVTPEALVDFVTALRAKVLPPQHSFCDVCGVERPEAIEAVYRLSFVLEPRRVTIRTRMPRTKPVLPTLSHLYKGALWPERELAEMFGVHVEGHPDLRHLLLPEDFKGFPLRKDYEYPLDDPYLAPDPLREDPGKVLRGAEE